MFHTRRVGPRRAFPFRVERAVVRLVDTTDCDLFALLNSEGATASGGASAGGGDKTAAVDALLFLAVPSPVPARRVFLFVAAVVLLPLVVVIVLRRITLRSSRASCSATPRKPVSAASRLRSSANDSAPEASRSRVRKTACASRRPADAAVGRRWATCAASEQGDDNGPGAAGDDSLSPLNSTTRRLGSTRRVFSIRSSSKVRSMRNSGGWCRRGRDPDP